MLAGIGGLGAAQEGGRGLGGTRDSGRGWGGDGGGWQGLVQAAEHTQWPGGQGTFWGHFA